MTPTEQFQDQQVAYLPDGSTRRVYAKDQPQYSPLPSIATPDGRVVTAWLPDVEELARLNAGEPVTLVCHTFNQPLQPIQMVVGVVDAR